MIRKPSSSERTRLWRRMNSLKSTCSVTEFFFIGGTGWSTEDWRTRPPIPAVAPINIPEIEKRRSVGLLELDCYVFTLTGYKTTYDGTISLSLESVEKVLWRVAEILGGRQRTSVSKSGRICGGFFEVEDISVQSIESELLKDCWKCHTPIGLLYQSSSPMAPPPALFTLRKSKIRARDFPQRRTGWACFLSKRGLRITRSKHVRVEKNNPALPFWRLCKIVKWLPLWTGKVQAKRIQNNSFKNRDTRDKNRNRNSWITMRKLRSIILEIWTLHSI